MLIYPTIDEHINKRPYPLSVPAFYMKQYPIIESGEPFTEELAAYHHTKHINHCGPMWPIFDNQGGVGNQTYTKLPIANMIDMYTTKVQFRIIDDRDTIDILNHLNRYIAESQYEIEQNAVAADHVLVKYIQKALSFQGWLKRLYVVLLKRNPSWREILEPEPEGVLKVIALLGKLAPTVLPQSGLMPSEQPMRSQQVSQNYVDMLLTLNRPATLYDV